ncbi:MAG: glutamyl-tRNA reductase [bacterium]
MNSTTHLLLFGTSYQLGTVAEREGLHFSPEDQIIFLKHLLAAPALSEAALLSTCNRTECYLVTDEPEAAVTHLQHALRAMGRAESITTLFSGFHRRDEEAARHLFRVAAGLESQLLGENQILAQVKAAYETACAGGGVGPILHRVFHLALQAGKRVRRETAISRGVISSGAAAADLLLGQLRSQPGPHHLVVVGAGKMAEMAVQQLQKRAGDLIKISLTSRMLCHAHRLARQFNVTLFPIQDLSAMLARADGLIAAVQSTEHIVARQHFDDRLSSRDQHNARDFICIDVGVPRNIDPDVGTLPHVLLHNIDDLGSQIQQTLAQRRQEVAAAETLLEAILEDFNIWFSTRRAAPVIADLQRYVERLCRGEIARYAHNFHPQDGAKLARFSRSLAQRIIHSPIQQLRAFAASGDENNFATLRRFFEFAAGHFESGKEQEAEQPQNHQIILRKHKLLASRD